LHDRIGIWVRPVSEKSILGLDFLLSIDRAL
jgi:hypothetical protein